MLGPPKFLGSEASERVSGPGAVAGLVWTAAGGAVQYVEAAVVNASTSGERLGRLTLTGQVGDVLEESAHIALSWIRSHAADLGLQPLQQPRMPPAHLPAAGAPPSEPPAVWPLVAPPQADAAAGDKAQQRQQPGSFLPGPYAGMLSLLAGAPEGAVAAAAAASDPSYALSAQPGAAGHGTPRASSEGGMRGPLAAASASPPPPPLSWDVHVHLPAGAVPKDGPSAGITLATALVSLLAGRTARADTAMTGELSLRGLVLPVGGVKEKLLAARHAGLKRVILPRRNLPDLVAEFGPGLVPELEVVGVERMDEVLAAAFDPPFLLLPHARL